MFNTSGWAVISSAKLITHLWTILEITLDECGRKSVFALLVGKDQQLDGLLRDLSTLYQSFHVETAAIDRAFAGMLVGLAEV